MLKTELRAVRARSYARTSVFLRSAIETADHNVDGIVRNLSADGACLSLSDTSLCPGAAIRLTLRHIGRINGKIIWAKAGRFGVSFERKIDPAAVMCL